MEKLPRSDKDFGGSYGHGIYQSDLFCVFFMRTKNGDMMELRMETVPSKEIHFEGYFDFKSDADCIAQLEPEEILEMLSFFRKKGKEEGREEFRREIAKLLGLKRDFDW